MSYRSQPALFVALVASLPAFCQVDATGEWSPRLHEDLAERMAGPDLGDYLVLPINDAAHTWQGFSTGKWEGNILTATTTDLKAGWIRSNGVPRSERLTEHWIRHGDYLTLISIVNDPVYRAGPFIRTTNFALDREQKIDPFPCETVVEVAHPAGYVPHHLPGTNPFLSEFSAKYELPQEAVRGGAETTYPEYQLRLAKSSAAAR